MESRTGAGDPKKASGEQAKPAAGAKQPLVARISLWRTRRDGRLTKLSSRGFDGGRRRSGDSSDSSSSGDEQDDEDEDDDDDDDEDEDDELGRPGRQLQLELDEHAQLEARLERAQLPEQARLVAAKELQRLRKTPSFMSDYAVTRAYLELLAELPWRESSEERLELASARRRLEADHHGLERVKERVLQYLAVRQLRGERPAGPGGARGGQQPILLFVGPPGTGKTSVAQSVAASLGRHFCRVALGGVSDQAAIRGHRRTYIAAMPGRLIQALRQARVNNPVLLLDELDKMCAGPQGDPAGALLEALDPAQNHTFTDHYLNVAFDLSRALFIATANSVEGIAPALLDRMEVCHLSGYSGAEKLQIARKHLWPKQVLESGLEEGASVAISEAAIGALVEGYTREAGVRQLERRLGSLCGAVALELLQRRQSGEASSTEPESNPNQQLTLIEAHSLAKYLGPAPFEREPAPSQGYAPGVAVGLAWSPSGGELSLVEAQLVRGSRPAREGLLLTGQLGSVMRESGLLALNWLRLNCHRFQPQLAAGLAAELLENTVHVHFPAGAVGKDGPSAGVAIVVALVSLCSGLAVAPGLAMTGEISLRGAVLRVGGLKAKALAAHRAQLRRLIYPARNEPELAELPAPVREALRLHPVSSLDEVLRVAFDGQLVARQRGAGLAPAHGLASKL